MTEPVKKERPVFARFVRAVELPTWAVAAVIYGSWLALTLNFHELPWYVVAVLGPVTIAWYGSLRHEATHGHPISPRVAAIVAAPPLGLIEPFPLYRKFHLAHHRNELLTLPQADSESYYMRRDEWERLSLPMRTLMLFHNTYAGRMLLGPAIYAFNYFRHEMGALFKGDFTHGRIWLVQAAWLLAIYIWVAQICGIPFWQYVLFFAYPGASLAMTRSFYEHRFAADPMARCVIVEKSPVLALLFLNNNLHAVHHDVPGLPWYELDGYYRANRDYYLEINQGYLIPGYLSLMWEFLFKPVFHPVHPGELTLQDAIGTGALVPAIEVVAMAELDGEEAGLAS